MLLTPTAPGGGAPVGVPAPRGRVAVAPPSCAASLVRWLVVVLWGLLVLLPQPASAQAGLPYLAAPDAPPSTPKKARAKERRRKKGANLPVPDASEQPQPLPSPNRELPPPAPEVIENLGRPFSLLEDLWTQRREALRHGDTKGAASLLARLVSTKDDAGWPDVMVFGDALAIESAKALDSGHGSDAVRLAEAAARLAPHQPGAYGALARARWRTGVGVWASLTALWHAAALSVTEPPLLRMRFGASALAVAMGLLAGATLLTLMLLYRYGRLLAHDLRHLIPGARPLHGALLAIGMYLLPIFLRVGGVCVLLVWLALPAWYYRRSERAAAAFFAVMLALVGFGLPQLTSHFAYPESRSQDVYLAVRDAAAGDVAMRLRTRSGLGTEELHALGLRARWTGRLDEAKGWLERAVKAGAGAQLLVALGNIDYLSGRLPAAIDRYQQALTQEPDDVVALFNLSRAYYGLTQHQKAGEAHRKALSLDYDRVEYFNQQAKRLGKTYIVEQEVPKSLLNVGLEYGPLHSRAVAALWHLLAGYVERTSFAVAAVLVALYLLGGGWLHRLLHLSRMCNRCGLPACKRCNAELPHLEQCGQCHHAFVERVGVEPQVRIQKEIQVHRRRARRLRVRQFLTFVLAGAGAMARGAAFSGSIIAVGFFASLAGVAAAAGILPPLEPLEVGLRGLTLAAGSVFALVFYLLGIVDGLWGRR